MGQRDTKQRILDAAERLFAREGFHSTSLRAITKAARANLAAVNYHFGSKGALIEAVFERSLLPLNRLRKKRLESVRETARHEGLRPEMKEVLCAFIEPTIVFRESAPGARDFITLVCRAIGEPDDAVRTIFMRPIEQVCHLFFDTLFEALPNVPIELAPKGLDSLSR